MSEFQTFLLIHRPLCLIYHYPLHFLIFLLKMTSPDPVLYCSYNLHYSPVKNNFRVIIAADVDKVDLSKPCEKHGETCLYYINRALQECD